MKNKQNLPRLDGFRMPAEHEPHAGIWMIWPERPDNWRLGGKPAQQAFAAVAAAITQSTPVTMVVSAAQYQNARQMLDCEIRVVEMSTNDAWMRDMGPTYLVNDGASGAKRRRGISWSFNAWGGLLDGLYFPWDLDDQVAGKVCEIEGDACYQAPLVLEGGSIHVDGEGTLYTTEECLLHPSRNPHLSKSQIEQLFADYLGIRKVIWLEKGLYDDETNGHIDNILHVVKPGEVVLSGCEDPADPQYAISQAAYQRLVNSTDAQGRTIVVHKLPQPGPLFMTEAEAQGIDQPANTAMTAGMVRGAGARLGASYTNYLISNDQIIFPLLDEKTDAQAQAVLVRCYPQHKIVGVPAREIVLGGGNIHCITQQIPKV